MSLLIDQLRQIDGIDVNKGLSILSNNENLYIKCLKMFVTHADGSKLPELFESGNIEEAIKDAHALKGVTGNLALTKLYDNYNTILAKLRTGDMDGVGELIKETTALQTHICDIVRADS